MRERSIIMTSLKTSLLAAGTVALSMGIAHNVSANSTYQVKSGDTLSRIASANHTSVNDLKNINHISNINFIYPGQILQLSAASSSSHKSAPTSTQSTSGPKKTYTVKAGDTASAVASKNGISLAQLKSYNHIANINLIYVGQVLVVGAGNTPSQPSQAASKPATSNQAPASNTGTYRVVSGDTMSAIASRHGMSLSALLNMNHMQASQIIYVGQTIKVSGGQSANTPAPAPVQNNTPQNTNKPTVTGSYTVKSGDTLYRIASQTGTPINTLLSVNGLRLTSIIYPGQVLKLSGSNTATPAPAQNNSSQNTNNNTNSNNNNNSSSNNSGEIKYIAAADTNHNGFMTMAEYNAYQNQNHNNSSTVVSNNTVTQVSVGDIKTAGLSATQIAWLRSAIVDARSATAGTGVRASITVAQAIIESGWGSSALAQAPYNNLFGIKSGSAWYGNQVMMRTGEYINGQYATVNASFRAYASQESSFRDHTNFLLQNGRYASNGVINSSSYQSMAYGLQQAGYATDPNYANTLISAVQRYNLSALD